MNFRFKLCIKRVKDVTIEAKSHKEALKKAKRILDNGLDLRGVKQVEWVESNYAGN